MPTVSLPTPPAALTGRLRRGRYAPLPLYQVIESMVSVTSLCPQIIDAGSLDQ